MEETMVVLVVAILAGCLIAMLRLILDYRKAKLAGGDARGGSLTAGELKELVRGAVDESLGRVEPRFDELERRLERIERAERGDPAGMPLLPEAEEPRLAAETRYEEEAASSKVT